MCLWKRISLRLRPLLYLVIFVAIVLPPASAGATTPKGLAISPLYTYQTVEPGTPQHGTITVSDLNQAPITVTLSAKRFSVANYTYDYTFSQPDNDWLKLERTELTLQPGQSEQIHYTLSVANNAGPGGYYYTLLASAQLGTGGIAATVQAGSLLYVTVNGALIKTGKLQDASFPRFSISSSIPYRLDARNTGNVHYFAYTTASLNGMLLHRQSAGSTYLLMPGTVRRLTGSIPTPWLPGVYHAVYGYRTDSGTDITRSSYLFYVPPWFIAFVLLVVLFGGKLRPTKQKTKDKK